MTCINYVSGVWFADDKREGVIGKSYLPSFQMLVNKHNKGPMASCSICKLKAPEGSLIGCDASKSCKKFHVRCAIRKGLIVDWKRMDQR